MAAPQFMQGLGEVVPGVGGIRVGGGSLPVGRPGSFEIAQTVGGGVGPEFRGVGLLVILPTGPRLAYP